MVLRIQAPGQGPGQQRPRLRPVASPVDPYVTPGTPMPKLDDFNWKALAELSSTLSTAFRQAENRYDKEVRDFAESNEDILYNLSRDANATLYADPNSDAVKELVKKHGIQGWQRPEVRERAFRVLGTKTFNESGILAWGKSRETVEAVARAMMAVPQGTPKEQQDAGIEQFMSMYEEQYKDVIGSIESNVAMSSFRKQLTALTVDVLGDASSLRGTIAANDRQNELNILAQDVLQKTWASGGRQGSSFKGAVAGFQNALKEMGKSNPGVNINKLAIKTLKAMGNDIVSKTKLDTTEVEDFQAFLDQLSESEDFLGAEDLQLDAIVQDMDTEVERRQRRQSSPEARSRMRAKVTGINREFFAGLLTDDPRSSNEIAAHLLQDEATKKMLDNGEIDMGTIEELASKYKRRSMDQEQSDFLSKARKAIEEGDADFVRALEEGTARNKDDIDAYESLPFELKAQLGLLVSSEKKEAADEFEEDANGLINEILSPFAESTSMRKDSREFQIQATALKRQSKRLGENIDQFRSSLMDLRNRMFPEYEELVKRENVERIQAQVLSSDLYKTSKTLQYKGIVEKHAARMDALSSQDPEAAQGITDKLTLLNAQVSAMSSSSMPRYIEQAREQLRQSGQVLKDSSVAELAAQFASEDLPRIRAKIEAQNASMIERRFLSAEAKTIQAEHEVLAESAMPFYPSMNPQAQSQKMSAALTEFRADPKVGDLEDPDSMLRTIPFYTMRSDTEAQAMVEAVRAARIGRYLDNPGSTDAGSFTRKARWMELTQEAGGVAQAEMYAKTRVVQAAYIIGMDLQSAASDTYGPKGMKLSTAFAEPGKDWRGNIDPTRIMFHTSTEEMVASVEKAQQDPESVEARGLMNLGYDPSNKAHMDAYMSAQRRLLDPLEKQPRFVKLLRGYRNLIFK